MTFEEFWGRQQYTDDNDDKAFAKEVWELALSIGVTEDGAHFGNYSQRLAEIAEGEAMVYGELAEAKRRIAELEAYNASRTDELAAAARRIAELEEWNRMLADHNEQLAQRGDDLEQQRDELLAAMERLSLYVAYNGDDWVQREALAAIAKVKQ